MRKIPTLLLLFAMSVFLSVPLLAPGCTGLGTGSAADLGSAALDCAKQGVQTKVGAILGTVLDLARKGGEGWEGSLLQLATGYGEDVMRCTLAAAEKELTGTRAIGDAAALERLKGFKAKKGW